MFFPLNQEPCQACPAVSNVSCWPGCSHHPQKHWGDGPPVFSALQMDDEDSILPRKLQVALEHILEQRNDLASDQDDRSPDCKHGKCSSTSQTAPPLPSLESGSKWTMGICPTWHWVISRKIGKRGIQGERLGAHPLYQDLILTMSVGKTFPTPFWP